MVPSKSLLTIAAGGSAIALVLGALSGLVLRPTAGEDFYRLGPRLMLAPSRAAGRTADQPAPPFLPFVSTAEAETLAPPTPIQRPKPPPQALATTAGDDAPAPDAADETRVAWVNTDDQGDDVAPDPNAGARSWRGPEDADARAYGQDETPPPPRWGRQPPPGW